jgi:hypothetical protein
MNVNNITQVPRFPKCKPPAAAASPVPATALVSSSSAAVNQNVALPSSDVVVNNVTPPLQIVPPPLQIDQDVVKNNTPRYFNSYILFTLIKTLYSCYKLHQ